MINYLSDLTKTNTNNTDKFCKNPAQRYQSLLKIHKCRLIAGILTSVIGIQIVIVIIAGFVCSISVLISLGILVEDYVYLTMRVGSLQQKLTRLFEGSKSTIKLFFHIGTKYFRRF